MMRGLLKLGGALMLTLVASGCDSPQTLEGSLVLGTVDAERLCDVNTIELQLRAQWQACPEGEPECEPPEETEVSGDRFSCPSSGPTVDLGVELASAGRYRVEVHALQASGAPEVECFVDARSGDTRVEVSSDRLTDASPLTLDDHGACP